MTYLIEILLAPIPIPGRTPIFRPCIESPLTPSNPGIVVQRATPPEYLAPGVRLLYPLIVRLVYHGRLVRPIILAVTQSKG